jgi:SpoVK/Ycf46/Vps4 family AAA+-type ATPase
LVHEIPTAKFVFVPPAMVPSLGDPGLVSALLGLNEKNSYDEDDSGGPTVLICEDADSILTTRAADNMPAISSVLNLTSGLLGDVIDIRVVATTNAVKSDIEPALLRSGRLAQYIQVPPIKKAHATQVLRKLLNDNSLVVEWPAAKVPRVAAKKERTIGFASDDTQVLYDQVLLADVFKIAKNNGWRPAKVKAKVAATRLLSRRPRPYAPENQKATGLLETAKIIKHKKASGKHIAPSKAAASHPRRAVRINQKTRAARA